MPGDKEAGAERLAVLKKAPIGWQPRVYRKCDGRIVVNAVRASNAFHDPAYLRPYGDKPYLPSA